MRCFIIRRLWRPRSKEGVVFCWGEGERGGKRGGGVIVGFDNAYIGHMDIVGRQSEFIIFENRFAQRTLLAVLASSLSAESACIRRASLLNIRGILWRLERTRYHVSSLVSTLSTMPAPLTFPLRLPPCTSATCPSWS